MLGSKNPAFTGVGEIRGFRLAKIKRSASERGIPYEVSDSYIWALFKSQQGLCALTGLQITFGRIHFSHETTASLDRIDSQKGYCEGNLQWVHKDINLLKRDLDQGYFLRLCKLVTDQASRKPSQE